MKRAAAICLIMVEVFIFSPPDQLFAQQKPVSVAKKSTLTQNSDSEVPDISLFVSLNYSGITLSDVNRIYSTIEKNLQLPKGSDFKIPYFILTGFRFAATDVHAIDGEFGVSLSRVAKDTAINYLHIYYVGGSYRYNLPFRMFSVFAGGGMGCMWVNAERTYTGRTGIAHVNGRLMQLRALCGIEFYASSGMSFAIEGSYSYAATLSPTNYFSDMTIKGLSGGIKIGIPLIKSLGI